MKRASYFLILIAISATLAIGFTTLARPASLTAIGFIGWALSPYLYLAYVIRALSAKTGALAIAVAFTLLMASFGIVSIVDAMLVHSDAQGGLVYIFVPLWQWAALILVTVPLYFLTRAKGV